MPEEETKTIEKKSLAELTEEERKTIVTKWKTRFKKAKDFRQPFQDKWLEMYYLYRGYREVTCYAYQTKLVPPIAFEVVETVKPRLASAQINISIIPRSKEDVKSKSLNAWDDLIRYDLDEVEFDDQKIDWINSSLIFGNGVAQLTWKPNNGDSEDDGDPFLVIQDLWLFYPDPEATDLQKDSRYEFLLLYKTKERLKKEEEKRGKHKLYGNLENLKNKKITDDPRKDRYEINAKKMGQIVTASGDEENRSSTEEKLTEEKLELLQVWDHEEDKLLVIGNQEELIRYEENPYLKINNGRVFYDLPDHSILWELWAIGHIEPIETTILEITDSRNQAMDDITFSLDPIRKVRKDAHITADDIVYEPGAIWELKRADDVVTERPPEISKQWIEKDNILRQEISTALAISEYAMGLPKSTQEPAEKINLLLMQTSIRFSLLLRQFEISTTRIVNSLIELNQEFLTKDKSYRLIGDEVQFKEFKQADKKVKVDAIVEIKPKLEKTSTEEQRDVLELYKIFVAQDKPDPQNPKEVERWKIKKRAFQKMILEEYGKEQYIDLILGAEEEASPEKEPEMPEKPAEEAVPPATPPVIPPETPLVPPATPPAAPGGIRGLMAKIPLLKRIV